MPDFYQNALKIVQTLKKAGFSAYIAGGAVRDRLMGIEPKDYDIATDASPDDIRPLFDRVEDVGAKFGVILVILDSHPYEVARFRSESNYVDGRRPELVSPAAEREDAFRRDFTINSLFYDPNSEKIIDYTGGMDDIESGIIRAVGDPEKRFTEDRLRMLRAVRFASRFCFVFDPGTYSALKAHASGIGIISAERIGAEIAAMISGPHPGRALSLLDDSGLLDEILPEAAAMKGVLQPEQFHPEGDVFEHTRLMLDHYGGGSVTLGFGILFHDVGKPATMSVSDRIRFNGHDRVGTEMAEKILHRLRQPKSVIERVTALVANHMRFIHAAEMRVSTFRRFIAMECFDELLELYRLDCLASHGDTGGYEKVLKRMENLERILPEPLIGGKDLIELDYEPGAAMGEILDAARNAQLDGILETRDDAIAWVIRKYPKSRFL